MKLVDLASTIRSKNAGVDHITFDIICKERANFERIRDAGVFTPAFVAELFAVAAERVTDFVIFEPANAIKFTILRPKPSGSQGETDIYGCQQYARLFTVEIP